MNRYIENVPYAHSSLGIFNMLSIRDILYIQDCVGRVSVKIPLHINY
jgi:hypothetical protein